MQSIEKKDNKRRKLFIKIIDKDSARSAVKDGAAATAAYSILYMLGAFFIGYARRNGATGEAVHPEEIILNIVIALVFSAILAGCAWRIYKKQTCYILCSVVLGCFLFEVVTKFMYGTTNPGWCIFYFFISVLLLNGIRGSFFIKKNSHKNMEENTF